MRIMVHDYAGHPFQISLSRELARRGHDVLHVYFGGDSGPKGDLRARSDDLGTLRFESLDIEGAYNKASLVRRRFADISYGKVLANLIAREKPDIVLSGNTPTEAQQFAIEASKRTAAVFIYWVQDFYSVAASNILKRKLGVIGQVIGGYYRMLERTQMKSSDGIVTITQDFEELARRWGGRPDKVTTIENWGLLDEITPVPKENSWSSDRQFTTTFNFLYSGTLALKHNPMLLVELARATRGRAHVIVVSEGVGVRIIERHKSSEDLDNLTVLPLAPFEDLKNVLGTADVAIAIVEPEAGSYSVPSKVQSYMCAGRPVLLAAPRSNLAARVVEREKAGIVVDSNDLPGFLAAAERMLANSAARAEFGRNGRMYADLAFDVSVVTDRFIDVFSKAIQQRGVVA